MTMKPINIDALKKLVERYETITLEEIEAVQSKKLLTGFGFYYDCILCSSIYDQIGKNDCSRCVYASTLTSCELNTPCYSGSHKDTYKAIQDARTSKELFDAYKARAKYIRETFSQYLQEPISKKKPGISIYKKIKLKLIKKYFLVSIILMFLGLLTLINHQFNTNSQTLRLTLGAIISVWFLYDVYITIIFHNLSRILRLRNQHRIYIAWLYYYRYGSERALEIIDSISKSEPIKFGIINFKTIPDINCLIVRHLINANPSMEKETIMSLLLISNKHYNELRRKLF